MKMRALCSGSIAALFLSACSSSSLPGAQSIVPQGAAVKSLTSSNLLYVAENVSNTVGIYDTSTGSKVGTITSLAYPTGLCSDTAGNVWVVNAGTGGNGQLIEYAHGSTTPMNTLAIPGQWGYGCAVDPASGNLAVTSSNNEVSVFTNAQGTPTTYTDSGAVWLAYCTYDNAGNLFSVGENSSGPILDELSGGTFSNISLGFSLQDVGAVQWDGQYLDVQRSHSKKSVTLTRLTVKNGKASSVGAVILKVSKTNQERPQPQFWISGNMIAMASGPKNSATWKYPQGGKPQLTILHTIWHTWGITISAGN